MNLRYLSADQLLVDSYELAMKIVESGYQPDLLVALWRGGTPIGIAMQEVFEYLGMPCQHFAIRSSSYEGLDQQGAIRLWGMELLQPFVETSSHVLLVDDVFDSGRTMQAVINHLHAMTGGPYTPYIKLATPWFKPTSNVTPLIPDFYLHETSDWLVFPHELRDLSDEQMLAKPGVAEQTRKLLAMKQKRKNP